MAASARDTISRLERNAIPEARAKLAELVELRRLAVVAIENAAAEKRSAPTDAEAYHAADERERRQRAEVERLDLVISSVAEARIAELESEMAEARRTVARDELVAAHEAAHQESKRVAAAVAALRRAVGALNNARSVVDRSSVAYRTLDGDPSEVEADETDWLGKDFDVLIETLAAGPRMPVSTGAHRAAIAESGRQHAREQEVARLVNQGELTLFDDEVMRGTPADILEEARARFRLEKAEALERRELIAVGERHDAWRNGE